MRIPPTPPPSPTLAAKINPEGSKTQDADAFRQALASGSDAPQNLTPAQQKFADAKKKLDDDMNELTEACTRSLPSNTAEQTAIKEGLQNAQARLNNVNAKIQDAHNGTPEMENLLSEKMDAQSDLNYWIGQSKEVAVSSADNEHIQTLQLRIEQDMQEVQSAEMEVIRETQENAPDIMASMRP